MIKQEITKRATNDTDTPKDEWADMYLKPNDVQDVVLGNWHISQDALHRSAVCIRMHTRVYVYMSATAKEVPQKEVVVILRKAGANAMDISAASLQLVCSE